MNVESPIEPGHGATSPPSRGVASTPFTDHASGQAISAYYGKAPSQGAPFLPLLWSFQFYVTFGATAASAPELSVHFLAAVRQSMLNIYPLRFDVYFLPGADTETCIAHYRSEKASRQQSGAPLAFVDKYNNTYHNFLILVDKADWESEGITICRFDPPPECRAPQDEDLYVPDVMTRQGVKVTRPPGTQPVDGSLGGEGPNAEGCLADVLHGMTFDTEAFEEGKDRYDEALEAGRSEGRSAPAGQLKSSTTISRFESLPPELRNRIYELVLAERYGIFLSMKPHSQRLWMRSPKRNTNVMACTAVSRRLRKESLPIFFSINSFTLETRVSFRGTPIMHEREFTLQLSCVKSWLQAVGEQDIREIGSLTVDASGWLFPGHVHNDIFPAWFQKLCGRVRTTIRDAPVRIDRVVVETATVDEFGRVHSCFHGHQVHELSQMHGEGEEALDMARGSELTSILINRESGS